MALNHWKLKKIFNFSMTRSMDISPVQTSKAVVPGLNPASLTILYCKSLMVERKTSILNLC